MQTVAIIDYGSGNLRSAAKAFERMAAETGLDRTIAVTADAAVVAAADRVVLPGVGAFAHRYQPGAIDQRLTPQFTQHEYDPYGEH